MINSSLRARCVSIGSGDHGAYCHHEHSCIRCPLLRIDPAQRARPEEIRDNLIDRVAEAQREGWAGEAEGLKVSLAAANAKLAQVDGLIERLRTTINLGLPTFKDIAARTTHAPTRPDSTDREP
ncbi:hypothetical protein [Actinomadura sp. 9N215]|uniref:hypothetical protein n=1 Tax=Actinomadura sp. 9N215 TaxID=3375150 RepID=UPI003791BB01